MKIAVIGMGYVGIPMAVMLANAGHDVTGMQRRSPRSGWKIDWLNEGRCPIANEPELPEMLERVVKAGRFKVTDDYSVLSDVDVILIDVQTPINGKHVPQYDALRDVCHQVGRCLRPRQVVILESTVAPGTTQKIVLPILESESGLKAKFPTGFGLCFSYERVMVGRLIHNIRTYPKVIGSTDSEAGEIAAEMYGRIVQGGIIRTNTMTAEVSKTVENAYRDVQIAFANEVAVLCERLGVNVYDVRRIVNGLPNDPTRPQSNPVRSMHLPGAGVGGHCLPKDSWLLLHGYRQQTGISCEHAVSLLADARQFNDWMPLHMVDLLDSALLEAGKTLAGATIGVLGYAFLENSDDSRNSPTIALLSELTEEGVNYRVHDPFVRESGVNRNLEATLQDCDAVVLMTAHDEYRCITPEKLEGLLKTRIFVDGRNLLNLEAFKAAGFIVRGIGRGDLLC